MTTYTNPDLHCHSVVRRHPTPEVLAARARANGGGTCRPLTDHDEVGGQQRAAAAAQAQGIPLTGVEISVTFAHTTVAYRGPGLRRQQRRAGAGAERTRGGAANVPARWPINWPRQACRGLRRAPTSWQTLELISRTHFGAFLVEAGVCKDTNEVFRKYLIEGKPGFVPHRWASLGDAVR